jgi:hypothetical protein
VGLRDTALAATVLSLWAATDAWYAVTELGLAASLSVVVGVLAGAALTGLAHEWGHFAGARLSGGTAPIAPAKNLLPLFDFDFERSDVGQFRSMSVGGNVTPWVVAALLVILIPLDAPGREALVSASIGFAVFALTVELPVIRRVNEGMDPRESLAHIRVEGGLRRGAIAGAVTAAVLFVLL